MPGIVVGFDGSANAGFALAWAVSEAAARSAPLTVVTVHDDYQLEAVEAEATELTEKAVSGLGEAKPASITVTAIPGSAADELLAAANGADMLVLGARGGPQIGGLAAHSPIGSVSNKVLHRAKCPVVLIPASTS
jgi:nucleotide-binding universal stress UspA family protein